MGVFSRYSKVVEADGSAMSVRTALRLINQVLDETLSEQESDFDGDTRWALAWFEESGMNAGAFGKAETLSKAKNTSVSGLVKAGFLESKAGKVRLLHRAELPGDWDPATDRRLTAWEVTQYLIGALETGGEASAAELLHQVGGGLGETARELAYRLYTICERKKWPKEALAYNALVVSWPEIVRLAAEGPMEATGQQTLV
jgi:putative DNA methylase